jgi:hypothetical protein
VLYLLKAAGCCTGPPDSFDQSAPIIRFADVLAARNRNSTKRVGHVTGNQFKQALNSKINLRLREDELDLLLEKYDDNMDGMVNYVAFAAEVDPPVSATTR